MLMLIEKDFEIVEEEENLNTSHVNVNQIID